jgi:hypothetical protein
MIRRRRIVKFETRKITVVRAATKTIDLWCEPCGASVAMVTPESAAEILMTNPRAVYRQVETGDLHFVEISAGELLICSESLRAQATLRAIVPVAQS